MKERKSEPGTTATESIESSILHINWLRLLSPGSYFLVNQNITSYGNICKKGVNIKHSFIHNHMISHNQVLN